MSAVTIREAVELIHRIAPMTHDSEGYYDDILTIKCDEARYETGSGLQNAPGRLNEFLADYGERPVKAIFGTEDGTICIVGWELIDDEYLYLE